MEDNSNETITKIYLLLGDSGNLRVEIRTENTHESAIEWVKSRTFIKGNFLVVTDSQHKLSESHTILSSTGTVEWNPISYAEKW